MCLVLEIIMLVMGIVALVRGKITILTRTGEVHGTPARVAGAFMILPLPLTLLALVAFSVGFAATGNSIGAFTDNTTIGLSQAGLVLICLIIAIVICAFAKKQPTPIPDDYHRYYQGPGPGPFPPEQDYFGSGSKGPNRPGPDDQFRR
jgi:hypothetical protein